MGNRIAAVGIGFGAGMLLVASVARAFQWPEVTYDGKQRDPEWLEKAYQELKDRVVLAEGRYFNLAGAEGGELGVGNCVAVDATVGRILRRGQAILRVDGGRIIHFKDAPTHTYANGSKVKAVLLVVGTYRYKPWPRRPIRRIIFSCRAAPETHEAVTREQFVEAIRSGMQLYFWSTCPQCSGSGKIHKRKWRDPYPGAMHKESVSIKEPCPRCNGSGRLRIKEIKKPPEEQPAKKP